MDETLRNCLIRFALTYLDLYLPDDPEIREVLAESMGIPAEESIAHIKAMLAEYEGGPPLKIYRHQDN